MAGYLRLSVIDTHSDCRVNDRGMDLNSAVSRREFNTFYNGLELFQCGAVLYCSDGQYNDIAHREW